VDTSIEPAGVWAEQRTSVERRQASGTPTPHPSAHARRRDPVYQPQQTTGRASRGVATRTVTLRPAAAFFLMSLLLLSLSAILFLQPSLEHLLRGAAVVRQFLVALVRGVRGLRVEVRAVDPRCVRTKEAHADGQLAQAAAHRVGQIVVTISRMRHLVLADTAWDALKQPSCTPSTSNISAWTATISWSCKVPARPSIQC